MWEEMAKVRCGMAIERTAEELARLESHAASLNVIDSLQEIIDTQAQQLRDKDQEIAFFAESLTFARAIIYLTHHAPLPIIEA